MKERPLRGENPSAEGEGGGGGLGQFALTFFSVSYFFKLRRRLTAIYFQLKKYLTLLLFILFNPRFCQPQLQESPMIPTFCLLKPVFVSFPGISQLFFSLLYRNRIFSTWTVKTNSIHANPTLNYQFQACTCTQNACQSSQVNLFYTFSSENLNA